MQAVIGEMTSQYRHIAPEVISIQNGGGSGHNGNGVIDKVYEDVCTKVGRLRKHSVLKSDWFSIRLVILTCKKEQVIGMFIK